jgi:amino acid transporter
MLSNLEILFSRLGDPGYAYLLFQPLLLYGIFFGVIFFCVGHYLAQPKCRAAALILIVLCSLAVMPALGLRHQALPRERTSPHADVKRINEQYQRSVDTKWIYFTLAIAATLSLLGGGKLAMFSNLIIIGGGVLVVLFSTWMHMKEAEIYHPDIIPHAVPVK